MWRLVYNRQDLEFIAPAVYFIGHREDGPCINQRIARLRDIGHLGARFFFFGAGSSVTTGDASD